jgi:general secretion pathway protein L
VRETLYLRLHSTAADAPTEFCLAADPAGLSWPVNVAPLGTVLEQAGGRRIVVLVPAEDVRLAAIEVPARQPAKILQAAPYLLEDQLAEEVEALHFALGPRLADGRWIVACAAHGRMEQWLAPFLAAGLRPDELIPEQLCLPLPEPPGWTALLEPGRVTLRSDGWAGYTCLPEDLGAFLGLAGVTAETPLRIVIAQADAPDLTGLPASVELLPGFRHPLAALLQYRRPEHTLNLLQGSYSKQENLRRLWLPWRRSAWLAAACVLLTLLYHGVAAVQLQAELARQEARNVARFQQLFPAETRIVNLAVQAEQQFQRLNGQRQQAGLTLLAGALADGLAEARGLNVQSLQYRDGALFVSLSGRDLQQLEVLRGWFSAARGARLEVQSANSGTEGVQIRIRLSPA